MQKTIAIRSQFQKRNPILEPLFFNEVNVRALLFNLLEYFEYQEISLAINRN